MHWHPEDAWQSMAHSHAMGIWLATATLNLMPAYVRKILNSDINPTAPFEILEHPAA